MEGITLLTFQVKMTYTLGADQLMEGLISIALMLLFYDFQHAFRCTAISPSLPLSLDISLSFFDALLCKVIWLYVCGTFPNATLFLVSVSDDNL